MDNNGPAFASACTDFSHLDGEERAWNRQVVEMSLT